MKRYEGIEAISLSITEDEVLFSRGSTPEVQAAHRAFEAQLAHTMNMIKQMEYHPHFTDDCGEYLAAALEISADLQMQRQEGAEALYEYMVERVKPNPKDWDENTPEAERIPDLLNYAGDGIASEITGWVKSQGWKDPYEDDEVPQE
jgi:hypothetical protein